MSRVWDLPCWQEFQEWNIKDRIILMGHVGSRAYGMEQPDSDFDIMGVAIAPPSYYLGLQSFEQFRWQGEFKGNLYDVVIYDLRKIMRLWVKNNPHTLQILNLPDHAYIKTSPEGKRLKALAPDILSQEAYYAIRGYAYAQLQLLRHRYTQQTTGHLGAKRKELITRHGWDVKAASQLIRLLRTLFDLLNTQELRVWRPDASELISVKKGDWTLEQVEEEAKRLFRLCEEMLVKTELRKKPDTKLMNQTLINILLKSTQGFPSGQDLLEEAQYRERQAEANMQASYLQGGR